LGLSTQILEECRTTHHIIQNQFKTHINEGFPVLVDDVNCTEDELERLEDILGTQDNPMKRVFNAMELRQVNWRGEVESFGEMVRENAESKLDSFRAGVDATEALINSAQSTIQSTVTSAGVVVDRIRNIQPIPISFEAIWPSRSIVNKFDGFQGNAFRKARSIWDTIYSTLKSLDINFPTVESFLPVRIVDLTGIQNTFSNFGVGIAPEVKNRMQSALNTFETTAGRLKSSVQSRLSDVLTRTTSLRTIFDDYNPPPFNFNVTLIDSVDLALSLPDFREWKYSIQDTLSEAKQDVKETTRSLISNLKSFKETLANLSLPDLQSVDWGVGKVKKAIQPTINLFNTIWKIIVIYDVVYRVEASLKTVFFYGKASFSQLPVIDLRRSEDSGSILDTISNIPLWAIGPAISILIVIILVITLVIVVIVRYTKLYASYVRGCVNSKSGTFFTKNANHIAYNLLNDTTTSYSMGEEQAYTTTIYGECKKAYGDSQSNGSSVQYQLRFDQQEFVDLSKDLELLGRCVLPSTYTNPSSNLSYPGLYLHKNPLSSPPDPYVNERTVFAAADNQCLGTKTTEYPWNTIATRSASDCFDQLPPCLFQDTCRPAQTQLSVSTHYAGCDSEWYLHSTIIKMFMTILVMICLNITRVFVMKFLVMFFFRELGTINVEVVLNYRFRTMEATVKRQTVIDEINTLVSSHKRKALIFLGVALICQVPYLAALFWFMSFGVPMR
jgi:hypothetical protein